MSEFNDADLHLDQDTDSDLVRNLRKQLREKDKTLSEASKELETYKRESRASTLATILGKSGVSPKVASLVPADLDITEEAVKGWLDEYAEAFNIKRTDTADGDDGGASGESGGGGLSADDAAAIAATQRTESGGQPIPLLGKERVAQVLKDVKALPPEQAFIKMREAGLVG